jgi:hypothetical protein
VNNVTLSPAEGIHPGATKDTKIMKNMKVTLKTGVQMHGPEAAVLGWLAEQAQYQPEEILPATVEESQIANRQQADLAFVQWTEGSAAKFAAENKFPGKGKPVRLSYADGTTGETCDTEEIALEAVASRYRVPAEDLETEENNGRTLVWLSAEDAQNDDGSNAVAEIV